MVQRFGPVFIGFLPTKRQNGRMDIKLKVLAPLQTICELEYSSLSLVKTTQNRPKCILFYVILLDMNSFCSKSKHYLVLQFGT